MKTCICFNLTFVEQVRGIEPPCSAWEADILPLNYTCAYKYLILAETLFPANKQYYTKYFYKSQFLSLIFL